jgi:hypothetical protein
MRDYKWLFDIVGLVILISVVYIAFKKFVISMIPITMMISIFGIMAYIAIIVSTTMMAAAETLPAIDGGMSSYQCAGLIVIVGFTVLLVGFLCNYLQDV